MDKQGKTAAVEQYPEVRGLVIGILINAGLTVAKFAIGSATHCAALVADGYKDLSHVAQSGLKLGFKHMRTEIRERKETQSGAARVETVISLAVFIVIVYMGIASFVGSVKDVLDQHDTQYTPALFTITILSIVLKAYMAHHKRTLGRKLHDQKLVHDGVRDAQDSVAAGMILAAAVVDRAFYVDIDPWVGCAIAIFIVVAGVRSAIRKRKARSAAPTR